MGPPGRAGRAGFRLRRAGLADLPTLLEHRHQMFVDIGRRTEAEIARHEREFRPWLSARLRTGEVEAYLCEGADGAAGSGALWWRRDHPRPATGLRPTPYIMSMYTRPEWRRRGVASAILRRLLDRARARRSVRVVLHASEAGRALYRALGFERTWEMKLELDPRLRARGAARPVRRRGRGGSPS